MTHLLEYHEIVRRRIPASVVVLGLFLSALSVSTSHAQISGVPASVTSSAFGGRDVNGTPSSVTSIGPRGFSVGRRDNGQFFAPVPNVSRHEHGGEHHRRSQDFVPFYYGGVYPAPYPVDGASDGSDSADDSDYQGGPTIFDRRGRGPDAYVPPVKDAGPAHSAEAAPTAPPVPEPPQAPTVLVFKDGRQLEVGNYAIVGQILYDLTAGHPRKVVLADLNLEATQKLNEDRGVIFQLPPSA
jgi:hypothetical protein